MSDFSLPTLEEFEAHAFAAKFLAAGEAYAHAAAATELLEEGRKVLLAKLIQEHLASGYTEKGKAISRTTAEDLAYADNRYREYLHKLRAQREESLRLRARFDTAKMYVELIRSQLSTRRAEMNLR